MQGKRKTKVGRVVSDKMDKTIVVSVERLARHRLYKRVIRLTTKFKAHDEANDARIGDTVLIEEARPLSATKRWRLVERDPARRRTRPARRVGRGGGGRRHARPSTRPPTRAVGDKSEGDTDDGRGPGGRRPLRRPAEEAAS